MAENRELTQEEMGQLVPLLARVTPLPKMEWPVLKTMWENRLMPMNPMELVIFNRDPFLPGNLKVFLVHRQDEYFSSCWHHPGGYLGASETISGAVGRVALKETGAEVEIISSICAANFPQMKRDHEFSLVLACVPKGTIAVIPEKRDFFSIHAMPVPLLMPNHVHIYKRALAWLYIMRGLPLSVRQEVLRVTSYLETLEEV